MPPSSLLLPPICPCLPRAHGDTFKFRLDRQFETECSQMFSPEALFWFRAALCFLLCCCCFDRHDSRSLTRSRFCVKCLRECGRSFPEHTWWPIWRKFPSAGCRSDTRQKKRFSQTAFPLPLIQEVLWHAQVRRDFRAIFLCFSAPHNSKGEWVGPPGWVPGELLKKEVLKIDIFLSVWQLFVQLSRALVSGIFKKDIFNKNCTIIFFLNNITADFSADFYSLKLLCLEKTKQKLTEWRRPRLIKRKMPFRVCVLRVFGLGQVTGNASPPWLWRHARILVFKYTTL